MENPTTNPEENFMNDFVSEELVVFKVSNGKEFSYKPTTGGDELIWIDKYLNADGTTDRGKLNRLKMLNLKKVPYTKEQIQTVLKAKEVKEWVELSVTAKWSFLNKLSSKIVGDIITEINKIDFCDEKLKKKS